MPAASAARFAAEEMCGNKTPVTTMFSVVKPPAWPARSGSSKPNVVPPARGRRARRSLRASAALPGRASARKQRQRRSEREYEAERIARDGRGRDRDKRKARKCPCVPPFGLAHNGRKSRARSTRRSPWQNACRTASKGFQRPIQTGVATGQNRRGGVEIAGQRLSRLEADSKHDTHEQRRR